MNWKLRFKNYYTLTKSTVTFANALTAVAGVLFAFSFMRVWNTTIFLAVAFGMTLLIASACVLNNILDRDIDQKMKRTKSRVSVRGTVSTRNMALFSALLGLLGALILFLYTNYLTLALALFGFFDYVVLYGMWSKRWGWYGTLVGAVSGALPVLAGYTAVTGYAMTPAGILLFLALFYWQIPAFYSIAIFRRDEYKKAGVPVVSVSKGIAYTKRQMVVGVFAFVISTLLLTYFEYTGYIYLAVMTLSGIFWIWYVVLGLRVTGKKKTQDWSRKMFRLALIILLIYSVIISVGPLLP